MEKKGRSRTGLRVPSTEGSDRGGPSPLHPPLSPEKSGQDTLPSTLTLVETTDPVVGTQGYTCVSGVTSVNGSSPTDPTVVDTHPPDGRTQRDQGMVRGDGRGRSRLGHQITLQLSVSCPSSGK